MYGIQRQVWNQRSIPRIEVDAEVLSRYAGGSMVTGRHSHAGDVEGMKPD
jgi:hypothetical protein